MVKLMSVLFALVVTLTACGDDDVAAPIQQDDVAAPTEEATAMPTQQDDVAAPTEEATAIPQEGGESEPPVSLAGPVNNHGTASVSGDRLSMELDDFYFEPTFVEAEAGSSFTVDLHNEGGVPHTFTVKGQDVDVVLDAGAEGSAEVTMPADAESLVFICRFHEAQGMQGAFHTGN
jgi:plastocyanin